MNENLKYVR